jgi:hypothetical protein
VYAPIGVSGVTRDGVFLSAGSVRSTIRTVAEEPYVDHEAGISGVHVVPAGSPSAITSACVVISGSGGGQETSLELARAFARAGIHGLGLAYHGAEGLRPTLADIPLEGFARAAGWLGERTGLPSEQVGLLGLSRGSEAVMLTGALFDDVRGRMVGVVPGNVVLCSWPPGGPAWLFEDAPLPFVSRFGPNCADPAAILPVERVGELLVVSAGEDEIWPSGPMSLAMVARRAEHGLATEHVHVPGAGHLVLDLEDRSASAPWPSIVRFVAGTGS